MKLGKLGITLPAPFLTASQSVELAVRAEQQWGYRAVWLAETNSAESFALAGAVAQATESLEIGTAIVPVYNRTPAVLAMAAGTLAQLSGDRFVLGLGTSSHAIIEGWNGVAFEAPLGRVRESVAILRQALAGEKTDLEGKTLRSRGFRLAMRPAERLRIYLAGLRERMLGLAGEIGEGLIINMMPVESMPRILGAYRAGAERAGRNADSDDVVARFQVAVTDDPESARNMVRAGFAGYVATPVYNKFFSWLGFDGVAHDVAAAFARGDRKATAAAMSNELVDAIAIIGSADECREKLAAFVEAGVTTPVLAPLAPNPAAAEAVFKTFAS